MKWRLYEDAKAFIALVGLRTKQEWAGYCKSGVRPKDIPANPRQSYGDDWISWKDFLSSDTRYSLEFLSFNEARIFVHKLSIRSCREWNKYRLDKLTIDGKLLDPKPRNIPSNPDSKYKGDWISWYDWFGKYNLTCKFCSNNISHRPKKSLFCNKRCRDSFYWRNRERKYTERKYKNCRCCEESLDHRPIWTMFCDNNCRDNYWKNKKKFNNKKYLSYQEAKDYINSLRLKSEKQWKEYTRGEYKDTKIGLKPKNIPSSPCSYYVRTREWIDWYDWLGKKKIHNRNINRQFIEVVQTEITIPIGGLNMQEAEAEMIKRQEELEEKVKNTWISKI